MEQCTVEGWEVEMPQGRSEEEAEAAVAEDLAAFTSFILTTYGLHFSIKE